jgi:hypothetical protein
MGTTGLVQRSQITKGPVLKAFSYTYYYLNPVPNAQVCVFDSTYYKITTTNYISKTSLYITFRMYSLGP